MSINIEKRCNHYRLIVACMLSGASRNRPVIVGWSTALRGEVINESLGQLPEETGSRPTRAGKDRIITHPIGDETGWITARSLGEVGATGSRPAPAGSGDKEAGSVRITHPTKRLPPPPYAVHGECSGVMIDADAHPAGIGSDVVDPVWHRPTEFFNDKVMNQNSLGGANKPTTMILWCRSTCRRSSSAFTNLAGSKPVIFGLTSVSQVKM